MTAGRISTKIKVSAAKDISVIQCHGMGLSGFKAVIIVKPPTKYPQLMKIKLLTPKFNSHTSTFSMFDNSTNT